MRPAPPPPAEVRAAAYRREKRLDIAAMILANNISLGISHYGEQARRALTAADKLLEIEQEIYGPKETV